MDKAELLRLIAQDKDVRAAVTRLVVDDARYGELSRFVRAEICREVRRPDHADA